MKNTYIIPEISISQAEVEQMLANSVIGSIDDEIEVGYGGIDDGGDLDPCVKEEIGLDFDWDS